LRADRLAGSSLQSDAFESAVNERFRQDWADDPYGPRSRSFKPAKRPVDGMILWRKWSNFTLEISRGRS